MNIFFQIFVFLFLIQTSKQTVIGIDLGSEFIKVSLISPGKSFQIVENSISKRKTESAISFVQGQRFFEAQALNKRTKYYQNTFVDILKYQGLKSQEEQQNIMKQGGINYELINMRYEDGFKFLLTLDDTKEINEKELSSEEILSMLLNYAKQLAEKQSQTKVVDCVITVDPLSSLSYRFAIYKASLIAGLRPLSFIGENSAAALSMAFTRADLNNNTQSENYKNNILFYNLGSHSLKVTLVQFDKIVNLNNTKLKEIPIINVLSESVQHSVSSLLFDQAIAQIVVQNYHQKNLTEFPMAMIKVLKEANKFKETLSANKQATFFVENILDGEDFRMIISREQFEQKCEQYFNKLTQPIDDVLQKANLTINDINGFEILGGAVRIPKVQQILQEYLDKSIQNQKQDQENKLVVSAHLNGDESMAFGAAFMAANISTIYKVKPVHFYDGYEFDIQVVISALEPDDDFYKSTVIFPYKTKFNTKKSIAFQHNKNVQIQINKLTPNHQENLITLNITNITQIFQSIEQKDDENIIKPKISIFLKLGTIFPVEILNLEITSEHVKQKEIKNIRYDKKEDNTTEKIEEIVFKNETEILRYKIESSLYELLKVDFQQIEESKKIIDKFVQQESILRLKAESRNNLETIIYLVNEKVEDEQFKIYLKEQEIANLKIMSQENDDWLYSDDADNSEFITFNKKFNEMDSILQRANYRRDQSIKRPDLVNNYLKRIENIQVKTREYINKHQWLNQSDIDSIDNLTLSNINYINMEYEKQQSLPLNDDPFLVEYILNKKYKQVADSFNFLKQIKKPIVVNNQTDISKQDEIKINDDDSKINLDDQYQEQQENQQQENQNTEQQDQQESQNTVQQEQQENHNQQQYQEYKQEEL